MFLCGSHRKLFAFLEESPSRRDRFEDRFACEGGGGGGSQDMVTMTNLLPTYITGIQTWATAYLSAAMSMMSDPGNFTEYPDPTYAAQNANELAGRPSPRAEPRGPLSKPMGRNTSGICTTACSSTRIPKSPLSTQNG